MKVIKYGSWRIGDLKHVPGLELDYCPTLWDDLHWGPQHVDLSVQKLLRRSYRRGRPDPDSDISAYIKALASGEEVMFWGEPSLPSCLAIVWVLDTLVSHGADLRHATLALPPVTTIDSNDREMLQKTIAARIPVSEVLQPLIDIRRYLASDRDPVRADLSLLPPSVQAWAAVTDLLELFVPDERGLDLIDSLILDTLMRRCKYKRNWHQVPRVQAAIVYSLHDEGYERCEITDTHVWERLLELAGISSRLPEEQRLVEVQCGERFEPRSTQVRSSLLGQRVRAGEVNALEYCLLDRWVGGRLIANKATR